MLLKPVFLRLLPQILPSKYVITLTRTNTLLSLEEDSLLTLESVGTLVSNVDSSVCGSLLSVLNFILKTIFIAIESFEIRYSKVFENHTFSVPFAVGLLRVLSSTISGFLTLSFASASSS